MNCQNIILGKKHLTFAALKKYDRSLDHVKDLSHLLHLNGFSPECYYVACQFILLGKGHLTFVAMQRYLLSMFAHMAK